MNNYQELDLNELEVINLTSLGVAIQAFCLDCEQIIFDAKRFGWLSGGCFALARGLELIFNKYIPHLELTFVTVGRTYIPVDHVAIKCVHPTLGAIYIDADGVATEEDINNKMKFMESTGTSSIKKLDLEDSEPFPISDFSDIEIPQKIFLASIDHPFVDIIQKEFNN